MAYDFVEYADTFRYDPFSFTIGHSPSPAVFEKMKSYQILYRSSSRIPPRSPSRSIAETSLSLSPLPIGLLSPPSNSIEPHARALSSSDASTNSLSPSLSPLSSPSLLSSSPLSLPPSASSSLSQAPDEISPAEGGSGSLSARTIADLLMLQANLFRWHSLREHPDRVSSEIESYVERMSHRLGFLRGEIVAVHRRHLLSEE